MLRLKTELIETIIDNCGYTISEIAARGKISRQTIYNILNDQDVTIKTLNKLADSLGVNARILIE